MTMLLDIRLISVAEYHSMGDLGILNPDEKVELLAGQIVKKAMKGTEGVSEANVNLERGEVEIRYESAKTSPEKLAATLNGLGYKAGSPRAKGSGP